MNLAQPRASSVTLDRAAGIATRAPLIAGFVLIGLGVWSIAFALEADLEAWRL